MGEDADELCEEGTSTWRTDRPDLVDKVLPQEILAQTEESQRSGGRLI